ncbi:calcium-binding protein [Shimia abyssi]|uniref:Hemolysin type calcium-binding protein n=1 Tax=Shimia abyssi TaxID=1662395 RepID=A0A2P8ESF0_9RHOB|nr:hypothetical protein [Shimia abyssi]PSL12417.1 hypothetical protein CLV88_1411 [Shimia abyssi]
MDKIVKTYVNAVMDHEPTGGNENKVYDTKTVAENDDNNNDAILTGKGDDLVKAGDGNDYVRAGRGDDNVGGQEGHDVIKLGRGDDRAFGGEGDDFIMGGRGNDFMDGGDGNDTFGAVNGSNTVRTGDGNDTVIVTYRQEKMEDRKGNEDGHAGENGDHFTTITDFEVGADKIQLTGGLKEGEALTGLIFEADKNGTMISDQDGNKIVYLRDVEVTNPDDFIANSMDFGWFDWKGLQLETLMKGSEAPGEIKDNGEAKLVNFKDKHEDYGVFDFGELGNNDEFSFFHGDDGHLSADGKALFSGSSVNEREVNDLLQALATGEHDGVSYTVDSAEQVTLHVTSPAYGGVTDTIVLRGDVVEQSIEEHFDFF